MKNNHTVFRLKAIGAIACRPTIACRPERRIASESRQQQSGAAACPHGAAAELNAGHGAGARQCGGGRPGRAARARAPYPLGIRPQGSSSSSRAQAVRSMRMPPGRRGPALPWASRPAPFAHLKPLAKMQKCSAKSVCKSSMQQRAFANTLCRINVRPVNMHINTKMQWQSCKHKS